MIAFIGHLYYLMVMLLSISYIFYLFNYNKIYNTFSWLKSFKKVAKKSPETKDYPSPDYPKFIASSIFILILEMLIIVIGILTQNWAIYLVLLLLIILTGLINNVKYIRYVWGFISIIVKISMYSLLYINHFHLHLDLIKLIF